MISIKLLLIIAYATTTNTHRNMKKINVKLTKDLEVEAVVIREFEADDASYLHQILYCQNRLIDYMVYPIFKEFKDEFDKIEDILENPQDILIKEDEKEWVYANVHILVDYCIIPELD